MPYPKIIVCTFAGQLPIYQWRCTLVELRRLRSIRRPIHKVSGNVEDRFSWDRCAWEWLLSAFGSIVWVQLKHRNRPTVGGVLQLPSTYG